MLSQTQVSAGPPASLPKYSYTFVIKVIVSCSWSSSGAHGEGDRRSCMGVGCLRRFAHVVVRPGMQLLHTPAEREDTAKYDGTPGSCVHNTMVMSNEMAVAEGINCIFFFIAAALRAIAVQGAVRANPRIYMNESTATECFI